MQEPVSSFSPTSIDLLHRQRFTRLGRWAEHHPYLSAGSLFLLQLAFMRGLGFVLGPVVHTLHIPFLPANLLAEALYAAFVAIMISLLGWWTTTGFTRGLSTNQQVVLCIAPIALLALPVLCGLPTVTNKAPFTVILMSTALALLVGFAEEGFFRGILLSALLPKGIWLATLVSSLLFACVHLVNLSAGFTLNYVVGQLLLAFGTGILLAALRLRTTSIWPGILLHAIRDVGGLILLSTNPKLVQSVPLTEALIVNGVFCAFFILNGTILLRPRKIRELSIVYQLPTALQPARPIPPEDQPAIPPDNAPFQSQFPYDDPAFYSPLDQDTL
ncbi:CPBP family intramembrane glutamic endopeptidase [Tengunoibacter tsumagoiensis]|uniref:CAAX prenyl protease 2/Lysostaphin resistance protein A-like domain-containing protein n=1 Tax=Tengunoibacter tsumagoiensis TaxID=2014871 RepID=A0A402A3T8_9CHLR|nr:type II CAAX endopeptidase family protein [Tengunoibacter tsumagoiensis]GCE13719.1 hypothetical protein KTT_35780 [Tengunoibacter tsumagoiensis]